MPNNISTMPDEEYEEWFRNVTGFNADDPAGVTEEDLVSLLSDAIRCPSPDMKADLYLSLANKAMAMCDKTLGAQRIVASPMVFKH